MKLKEFKAILLARPTEQFYIEHKGFFDKNQVWYARLWPATKENRYESVHFTLSPNVYLSAGGDCSIGCLGEIFDMKSLSFITKESYEEKIQTIKQLLDSGKFSVALKSGKRLDISSVQPGRMPAPFPTQLTDADVQFLKSQF
jgi:hypothetical protein